jgi:hypothetical protein
MPRLAVIGKQTSCDQPELFSALKKTSRKHCKFGKNPYPGRKPSLCGRKAFRCASLRIPSVKFVLRRAAPQGMRLANLTQKIRLKGGMP